MRSLCRGKQRIAQGHSPTLAQATTGELSAWRVPGRAIPHGKFAAWHADDEVLRRGADNLPRFVVGVGSQRSRLVSDKSRLKVPPSVSTACTFFPIAPGTGPSVAGSSGLTSRRPPRCRRRSPGFSTPSSGRRRTTDCRTRMDHRAGRLRPLRQVVFFGGVEFDPPPPLGTTGRTRYVKLKTLEEARRPELQWIEQAGRVQGWK